MVDLAEGQISQHDCVGGTPEYHVASRRMRKSLSGRVFFGCRGAEGSPNVS